MFVWLIPLLFGVCVEVYGISEEFVAANNDFGMRLCHELIKTTGKNLVYSAYSTGRILALTSLGAGGDTANQIKTSLNLIGSDRDIKNWFKGFTLVLNAEKGVTIDTAIKAYLAECITIEPEFKKIATDVFDAEIGNVNFYDPEAAANEINNWIQNKTNNKVQNLIQENKINALTRFILIDSLYFSGKFRYPFSISVSEKHDFYITKTKSSKVEMMKLTANLMISKHPDLGATMIFLPYKNKRANLWILLPDKIENVEYMQNNILTIWHSRNFTQECVEVWLPRFRVESTLELEPPLKKLGITHLFNKPDLSGITKDAVAVSVVTQKILFETNEIGTNVGSATGVKVDALVFPCHKRRPYVFKVDKPFVYAVLYDGLGILGGRVNKL